MKRLFSDKEAGTSMIELIIAAALLAIVGTLAAQFFSRVGSSEYEARARSVAVADMALLVSSMERDFKLRDMNAASTKAPICSSGSRCKTFKIDSKVSVGGADQALEITFSNSCVALPNSMAKIKKLKFDRAYDSNLKAMQGECMKAVGCTSGTYPQVMITLKAPSGARLPMYPRLKGNVARFPDLNDKVSAASSVIGAALCANASTASMSNDRMVLESAFLTAEGEDFRVEKREVAIPRSNVAKIQMLPGN